MLLSSPFVLGQTLFNVVASFCGPLLCFWLIFSRGGPYAWNSGEVLGPICASPLACAILAPAFVPIGMTDAVSRGWFGPVPSHDDGVRCLAGFLPSLRVAKVLNWVGAKLKRFPKARSHEDDLPQQWKDLGRTHGVRTEDAW